MQGVLLIIVIRRRRLPLYLPLSLSLSILFYVADYFVRNFPSFHLQYFLHQLTYLQFLVLMLGPPPEEDVKRENTLGFIPVHMHAQCMKPDVLGSWPNFQLNRKFTLSTVEIALNYGYPHTSHARLFLSPLHVFIFRSCGSVQTQISRWFLRKSPRLHFHTHIHGCQCLNARFQLL